MRLDDKTTLDEIRQNTKNVNLDKPGRVLARLVSDFKFDTDTHLSYQLFEFGQKVALEISDQLSNLLTKEQINEILKGFALIRV